MIGRLVPRSFAGQILLVIALALLAAQLIGLALLIREREREIFTQTSAPAIARLADALERADAGFDPMVRENGWRDRRIRVTPFNLAARQPRARGDVADRARELLADAGLRPVLISAGEGIWRGRGGGIERHRGLNGEARDPRPVRQVLVLSAGLPDSRFVSVIAPLPPRAPGMAGWLIVQTVLLYVMVLLPVWWLVRRLARPLAELRSAAEAFRSAVPGDPVAESGPSDIRSLIAAFNAMRLRLAAMLAEKDRMLGAIGHDLRTPLAALRVRVESVEDDSDRARMEATIDEMNRTLEDILALARIGRTAEAPVRVDLGALAEAVIGDFDDLGADVAMIPHDRITITVRPNAIKRALRNLVENAVKYAGSAEISISRDPATLTTSLWVRDSGPGIDPAAIDSMFDPFTRVETSRNRETGGTGLGLAIARGLVEAEGGTLAIRNRDGGGLEAVIALPG